MIPERRIPPWVLVDSEDEPHFWERDALSFELNGVDPLTGKVIAHSYSDRERLDAAARARLAA